MRSTAKKAAAKKAAPKPAASSKTAKVGDVVKVSPDAEVVRPNGTTVTVTDGLYALMQVGTYVIDGQEYSAK